MKKQNFGYQAWKGAQLNTMDKYPMRQPSPHGAG